MPGAISSPALCAPSSGKSAFLSKNSETCCSQSCRPDWLSTPISHPHRGLLAVGERVDLAHMRNLVARAGIVREHLERLGLLVGDRSHGEIGVGTDLLVAARPRAHPAHLDPLLRQPPVLADDLPEMSGIERPD